MKLRRLERGDEYFGVLHSHCANLQILTRIWHLEVTHMLIIKHSEQTKHSIDSLILIRTLLYEVNFDAKPGNRTCWLLKASTMWKWLQLIFKLFRCGN